MLFNQARHGNEQFFGCGGKASRPRDFKKKTNLFRVHTFSAHISGNPLPFNRQRVTVIVLFRQQVFTFLLISQEVLWENAGHEAAG